MHRFKVSLLAACGLLVLAFVLNAVGPRRALAALGYTPVRDVDNPAGQPFGANSFVRVDTAHQFASTTFVVPAGKRLVIEHIAISGNVDVQGDFAQEDIRTTVNGTSVEYTLPDFGLGGPDRVNVPVRFYADPGSTVALELSHPGGSHGDAQAFYGMSGYLVNVP